MRDPETTVETGDQTEFDNVAVIIPCKDEAAAISKVVEDFRHYLPGCTVYVYDNNSSDNTAEVAQAAGAVIGQERRPGKGNVVRRMFSEVEAEIYVMVDGDDTYDASQAPQLVALLKDDGADMVVAARLGATEKHERRGHAFGNRMFNILYSSLLGREFSDIFSGYRAFTRRFVKSFPALSTGFEIETELSAHASQLRLPVAEIPFHYKDRAEGSQSKLSTLKDGARILKTIIVLIKEYKPLYFFGFFGLMGILLSLGLFMPVLFEYLETGLIRRMPTAILCTGITVVSILSITVGVVLDSIRRFRAEVKRMFYNSVPGYSD